MMSTTDNLDHRHYKRHTTLALSVCAILLMWCWTEARGRESKRSSYRSQVSQTRQMSQDALRIESLRYAPQLAVERERPNDELLAEVQDAIIAAALPLESWVGNDPQPPVRLPRSSYKRLSVRLMFEEITLRQLVQFAFHLTGADPALSIPHLRLSAPPHKEGETWNVDLAVSYLIYAPYKDR